MFRRLNGIWAQLFERNGLMMKKFLLFVSLGLLAACSTTDEQTDEQTLEAATSVLPIWTGQFWIYIPVQGPLSLASREADMEAKQFLPVPDKAVLYIYRNQFIGSAWQIPITINGEFIGRTGGFTFFRKALSPGEHVIESWAEEPAQLTLNLEAGNIYYVRHKTRSGTSKIRAALHLVDEATGQAGVEQSRLLLGKVQMQVN